MIIVVTTRERDNRTGRSKLIVSHGVDDRTGRIVILPCDTPDELGAEFDASVGEFVLAEHNEAR